MQSTREILKATSWNCKVGVKDAEPAAAKTNARHLTFFARALCARYPVRALGERGSSQPRDRFCVVGFGNNGNQRCDRNAP